MAENRHEGESIRPAKAGREILVVIGLGFGGLGVWANRHILGWEDELRIQSDMWAAR